MKLFGFVLLLATLALANKQRELPVNPNIVVIFADDLGYGDLPAYGNTQYSTPHIDQLASEGMLFKTWYSGSAICTPSRAALLTGQYPVRSGLVNLTAAIFLSPAQAGGFTNQITIPSALKTAPTPYRTGMVGKWHLGMNQINHTDSQHFPSQHGFDYASLISPVGNNNVCENPNIAQNPNYPFFCMFMHNTVTTGASNAGTNGVVSQSPWSTNFLPDRMHVSFQHFLNCTGCSAADKAKPFFWYHASLQTHTPLYATGHPAPNFGDALAELDQEVGLVMSELHTRGLDTNTLVFFVSDNGPFLEDYVYEHPGQSTAGPFRGGKSQTWEGGFRVPAIAWFPGFIPSGSVRDEMVTTMDIFPTALRLAGVPLPTDRVIDGKDMTDLLFDRYGNGRNDAWKNDAFIYYCNTKLFAARWKKFKVAYTTQNMLRLNPVGSPPTSYTISPTPTSQCGGECCPLAPGTIALCPCEAQYSFINAQLQAVQVPGPWITAHAVPPIYDLEKDIHEDHPLTPDNFDDYYEVFNTINAKVQDFEATLGTLPVSQLQLPPNPALQPICINPGTHQPMASCNFPDF